MKGVVAVARFWRETLALSRDYWRRKFRVENKPRHGEGGRWTCEGRRETLSWPHLGKITPGSCRRSRETSSHR